MGNESHRSRVPEKAPTSFNIGIFVSHGIQALFSSLAAASYALFPQPEFPPPVTPLMPRLPLLRQANSSLRASATVSEAAAIVGAAKVSDFGHLSG